MSDDESTNRDNYASKSASAILMMVFQFCKDQTAIHRYFRHFLRNCFPEKVTV